MKYMHYVKHFFHCSYGKAPVHPLMPKSSFEDTGQNIFFRKRCNLYKIFFFYKVNTPAIHHNMHSSLLSIICIFLACKEG
jgi:hypothetical protein